MPRFFFHVYDDIVALDNEGVELSSIERAKDEAIRGARALACEEVLKGDLHLDHRIEVADESGAVLEIVNFRDVVAVDR
jgi:hypothetical protein